MQLGPQSPEAHYAARAQSMKRSSMCLAEMARIGAISADPRRSSGRKSSNTLAHRVAAAHGASAPRDRFGWRLNFAIVGALALIATAERFAGGYKPPRTLNSVPLTPEGCPLRQSASNHRLRQLPRNLRNATRRCADVAPAQHSASFTGAEGRARIRPKAERILPSLMALGELHGRNLASALMRSRVPNRTGDRGG
jgi:hypothetical protein